MSIPTGMLKHIPCPNGTSCISSTCLFGHPDCGQNTVSYSQLSSDPKPAPGSPDKRVKTDSFGYEDSKTPPVAAHYKSKSLQDAGPTPESQPLPKKASPSRLSPDAAPFQPRSAAPGSPSVLKRKRTESSESIPKVADLSTAVIVPASNSSSYTHPRRPSPSAAPATPVPGSTPSGTTHAVPCKPKAPLQRPPMRKAETLNPRYVALAPAKHEIRVRLLKLLHHEFTRLNLLLHAAKDRPDDRKQYLLSPQGLIWLALDTEEQYATSKSSTVYSDTIKHRIMEFKRMTISQWVKERKEAKEKARLARQSSSAAVVPTKAIAKASITDAKASASSGAASQITHFAAAANLPPPKPIVTGLPPSQELALLQKHFLTPINKLDNHGFVPSIPTDADIQKARDAQEVSKGWEQCERCLKRFQVFPGRRESDGALTSGGICVHHPGKFKRTEQKMDCCGEYSSSAKGCETSPCHIFKVTDPKRLASLWNFVETPPNASPNVHKAVSFDCEMAYTVYGLEVVRVTATSWPKGEVILDVLVRPLGSIIDFNSKFSGVFASDFAAASLHPTISEAMPRQNTSGRPVLPLVASPQDARSLLHSLISPETVLLGHALENDLRALRMVHNRVSDTALLYPHPKGLPIRYSLRVLAKDHMDRIVQTGGNVTGHDSAEDARVAGELVLVKIKIKWASMRRDGWELVDGVMTKGA